MRSIFGGLIRDVAIYGTGDLVLKATAIITLPIYTRLFSPEEYGIWSFVTTTFGLVNSVLILGGDSAYARFFFQAKSLDEKQRITSTTLWFLVAWSAGMIALFLPFTERYSIWSFGTPRQEALFALALLVVPVSIANTICGQVLRNQFQAVTFMILNVSSTLLTVGLSLFGVIGMKLGLVGIFGGTLLAGCLMLPLRLWSVRGMLRPVFSLAVLRGLLGYGVPLVPTTLAYWVFAGSDRLLLGKFSTLDQLGMYTVASGLTGVLGLVNAALGQAWSPHAFQVYEHQRDIAPAFFGRAMTYFLAGFGALCVGITIFAPEILRVMTTPAFYPAADAVAPLALGLVASASIQVTAAGITLSGKTYYFALFSWLAAIINLGLNLLVIPRWGMVGAGWTTMLAFVFLTVAYFVTSQRLWRIAYERRRVITIIVLTMLLTLAGRLLPQLSFSLTLFIKGVCYLAYFVMLFLLRAFDSREWMIIRSVIRGRA